MALGSSLRALLPCRHQIRLSHVAQFGECYVFRGTSCRDGGLQYASPSVPFPQLGLVGTVPLSLAPPNGGAISFAASNSSAAVRVALDVGNHHDSFCQLWLAIEMGSDGWLRRFVRVNLSGSAAG